MSISPAERRAGGGALRALAARRATGVEAGEAMLRIAQRRGGREPAWRLATVALADPESPAAADGARRAGITPSPAVCVIASSAIEIFPLNLPAGSAKSLDALVVEEARARVSYPIERSVLDFALTPEWARRDGDDRTGVLVYAVPRETVDGVLARLDALGLEVRRVLTPACVYAPEAAAGDPSRRNLLIVAGDDAASVAIVQGGQVLLERILPWGTSRLTEKLRSALETTPEQAAALLRGDLACCSPAESAASPGPDDISARAARVIGDVLGRDFIELANEAAGCLGYCGSFLRGAPTASVLIAGTLADSAAARDILGRALELPVLPIALDAGALGPGAERPAYETAARCARICREELLCAR